MVTSGKKKRSEGKQLMYMLAMLLAFALFMFIAQVGILLYFAEQQFESEQLAQSVVFSVFGWMIIGAVMSLTSTAFMSIMKMSSRKKKR